MEPFYTNIAKSTLENPYYRKVLYTVKETGFQLVLMSLLPKEEIGVEIHPHTTQFIRIEQGEGVAILNGKKYPLKDDMSVTIPNGTQHNIINMGEKPMKLYTIYCGEIQHPDGLIEKTKQK